MHGNLSDALESYSGKIYLEMTYADLAGWKPWLDYPIDLPRGRGGMRGVSSAQTTAYVATGKVRWRWQHRLPQHRPKRR
mgnify:CR=1 FL=1